MNCYDSIGSMIKWYIKCRNKTITETADAMNIKKTTFSAQLINNSVTSDTLLRLAAYLDIDLEWMMIVLGYYGPVSIVERQQIPRMRSEFRKKEQKGVIMNLDRIIKENPISTTDTRRELLKAYSNNMFYLLDVLVPEEYKLYMIPERGEIKFYVDIPRPTRGRQYYVRRRKPIKELTKGSKALDIAIEERKKQL